MFSAKKNVKTCPEKVVRVFANNICSAKKQVCSADFLNLHEKENIFKKMDIPEFMFLSFRCFLKVSNLANPMIFWRCIESWRIFGLLHFLRKQPHVFSRLWWSLVKILESLHWLPGKFQKTLKCFSSFTQNSPRKGKKTLLYIFFQIPVRTWADQRLRFSNFGGNHSTSPRCV